MSEERRLDLRRVIQIPGRVLIDGIVHRCVVTNISATGARIELESSVALPEKFILDLTQNGLVLRSCILKHQDENSAGVGFVSVPTHVRTV